MVSHIWLKITEIIRKTCCCDFFWWLTRRLMHTKSHRQDSTCHSFCSPVLNHWLQRETVQRVHQVGLIQRSIALWVNAVSLNCIYHQIWEESLGDTLLWFLTLDLSTGKVEYLLILYMYSPSLRACPLEVEYLLKLHMYSPSLRAGSCPLELSASVLMWLFGRLSSDIMDHTSGQLAQPICKKILKIGSLYNEWMNV